MGAYFIGLILMVTSLMATPSVVAMVTNCPATCDCSNGDTQLQVTCFVRDIKELDMYALVLVRREYSLTVNCESGIPIDLTDNIFGKHPLMKSLALNNCKISFIWKNAFSELYNLIELKVHSASNHYLQFHPHVFNKLEKLNVLEFTDSGIQQVPNLCPLHKLRILNLTGNSLVTFNNSGLNCTKDELSYLSTLDISRNYFHSLGELEDDGKSFERIEILNAARNKIRLTSDDNPFVHFPRLATLDLSENEITLLPKALVKVNTNLMDLRLSNNQIDAIPESFFEHSRKILQLDIQNNNLDDSVWICLAQLSRLLHLDASFNKLTFLNQTTLEQLTELGHLHLQGNDITGVPIRTFQNHLRLQTLNLAGNKIQTIEKDSFFGLLYLNQLHLDDNGIYKADPDFLNHATALRSVNLSSNYLIELPNMQKLGALILFDASNNHITTLEEKTFIGQAAIQDINLSNNRITKIHDSIFLSCKSLKYLDISKNSIKFVRPSLFMGLNIQKLFLQRNNLVAIGKSFADLKQLQELNLSHNDISDTIQKNMFPDSLEMLDMSHNQIETIRSKAFDGLSHIRMIDLRFNAIRTLSKDALDVSTRLYSQTGFRINNNPLQCDCRLSWLKWWDQSTQGPIIVSLNDTWCSGAFDYPMSTVKHVPTDRFLCKYSSICGKQCKCCSFAACDCKYACPEGCDCYHSADYYSTHLVKCSSKNIKQIDRYIPRIATLVDYSGSGISRVPSDVFIGMDKVDTLYLNNTKLNVLSYGAFKGLGNLTKLYLNNNLIPALNKHMFLGLTSLRELYLSYNYLTEIPSEIFDEMPLQVLNLSHNYLHHMTDYLSTFVFGRVDITLHGNPWNCDCILYFSVKQRIDAYVDVNHPRKNKVPKMTCFNGDLGEDIDVITRYADRCEGGGLITEKPYEDLTAIVNGNKTNNKDAEESIPQVKVTKDNYDVSVWNDHLKIYLPAIVAATIVFIVIIVLLCRREFVRCWFYSRYRRKQDELEVLDDKRRYFDAFIAYHPRDELYVTRELALRLERGKPKYILQLQHRDHPAAMSELTYIDKCVKNSQRTVLVISSDFINDYSLLKCVTQAVRRDSINRLVVIKLGNIDANKLDPVLQQSLKQGRKISYGERWFWDKLHFCLPDPGKYERDTRAEAHPYASTDLIRLSTTMRDNQAYEDPPTSENSRQLPDIVEYNLPSLHDYDYNASQSSSNIYEEIKDHQHPENISVKYAEPWKETELVEHVHTLSRASSHEEPETSREPETSNPYELPFDTAPNKERSTV